MYFPSNRSSFAWKGNERLVCEMDFIKYVWYNIHVANNDATQYCETTEQGTAEIRSQKQDRMRVQEVRADGKVVVVDWIYRPCRFIEMSPSVSRYFWYYDEDSLVHWSWKYKKKKELNLEFYYLIYVSHILHSPLLFTRRYVLRR